MKQLLYSFEMSISSSIKAYKCLNLIKKYASKYGIFYSKYGKNNKQKLKDINLFLEQSNEAYILRKYHIKQEIQYLEVGVKSCV